MQYRVTVNQRLTRQAADRPLIQPAIEIAAVMAIPLLAIWVAPLVIPERAALGRTMAVMVLLGLAVAVAINAVHREAPHRLGFRLDNLAQASPPIAAFTLAGAAILLCIGWALGSVHLGRRFAGQLVLLPLWGIEQQYGLQAIINTRSQKILGQGPRSILLTAALFSLLHMPNPVLVGATFVAGCVWSAIYQRFPNLPALALSHGILSAILANSLPVWILPNMKVGWGYW